MKRRLEGVGSDAWTTWTNRRKGCLWLPEKNNHVQRIRYQFDRYV